MSAFKGFPPELFTFFEGLEQDNSKTYWEAHGDIWEKKIQRPVQEIIADLEPEFGPLRTFRPNRDVRFSKDKSPYKLWVGVTSTPMAVGGVGFFLRLEASGIRMAAGAMVMARDQLERFRAAIAHDVDGPQFEKLAKKLEAKSLPVTGGREPALMRTPRGYPPEHPRGEFLRWKGAVVIKEYERAKWMHTPKALDKVLEVWRGAKPLKEWIDAHVGPSQEPPRLRGR